MKKVGLSILMLVFCVIAWSKLFTRLEEAVNKAIVYSYENQKKGEAWQKAYGPAFKVIFEGNGIKNVIYLRTGKSVFITSASQPNTHTPEEIEEILKKECPNRIEIYKKEFFPYAEKIPIALEEYASYFLFWEAYAYTFSDRAKAKYYLTKVAERYPEVAAGKIAGSVLNKVKDEETLVALVREEFSKLSNPVESYKPRKGEPQNSIMNNLKIAIASSQEYKEWKKYADLSDIKSALAKINTIIDILDGYIARKYYYLMYLASSQEQSLNYQSIILKRYPHTKTACFLQQSLKEMKRLGGEK